MESDLSISSKGEMSQEHVYHAKDLTSVFQPRSIAVIGASSHPEKIGYQILNNICTGGFEGEIYPVNPKVADILGLQCYPDVEAIPADVELAVISIPAPHVQQTLEACARKGVKSVAVITSGFAEVGRVEEEARLKRIADEHQMALLGPNMFGVVYSPAKLNASFGPPTTQQGKIAFISQSGALAIAVMGWTEMEKIGLSSLVNLGNKADIEERALVEYFNNDAHVDAILIYMEGLKDGRIFMQTKIKKPVVVLKVGRSQRGAKAAASHTGSLAGSDKVYDAAFKQLGILRASSFTEAFGWSRTLSLPAPDGEDAVIITNGGGIGVRTTDECEKVGVRLLDDPAWMEEKFRKTMPDFGSTKNPVDITGQTGVEGYRSAVEIALAEEKVKAIIVLYCETVITNPTQIARAIETEYDKSGRKKPIVVAMVGGDRTREGIHYLNEHRIPGFISISEAVSALRVLFTWRDIAGREPDRPSDTKPPEEVRAFLDKIRKENRKVLLEHEARQVLEMCGVPTPAAAFAADLPEALRKAEGLYPLAMKIASPDIIHKTDVDGVVLNIRNAEELTLKFNNMMEHIKKVAPAAKIDGVNLVQMVRGIECIAGLSHDPQFGPVVMFGLGGVFVEVLKDVAFRIVPFGECEAGRLVADIKGREILEGFRGMKADKPSIIRTLCAMQKLSSLVKEIDINPLITNQNGSFAADARIIL